MRSETRHSQICPLDVPAASKVPSLLQGLLTQRYTKQTPTVLNRGKAGEQAVDGQSRFIDVLRQDSPQVVLLLDGYNDLNAYGKSGITRAVGAIETMVKQARSRGMIVLLATLPPERPGAPKTLSTSITTEFNKQIIGTAQDEGAHFRVANIGDKLTGFHLPQSVVAHR